MGKKKNGNDDSLIKLEIGKGWKKPFSKLNTRQIAIVIIAVVVCYLLVEFLKWILESKLMNNPNLLVLIIGVVLISLCFIVTYAIDAFSENKKE